MKTSLLPVLRSFSQFFCTVKPKAKSRINRTFVACPPQQLPNRLVQGLAFDVPQGNINCGDCMHAHARLAARNQKPIQLIPNLLMPQRVIPEQFRCSNRQYGGLYRHCRSDRGQPVPGYAFICVNFHYTDLMCSCFHLRSDIQFSCHIQCISPNSGNFHLFVPRVPHNRVCGCVYCQLLTMLQAISKAAVIALTSALPEPAISKAVPCAGVVTGNGMPP